MQKKSWENVFCFSIVASELVVLNCLYSADNACHPQAMSQKKCLRNLSIVKRDFLQCNYLQKD